MFEPAFPTDPEAKRAALMAAVDQVAPIVSAHVDATEDGRTLAPAVAQAFRESGLIALKTPSELGGAEAHPNLQMDVIEAVTILDPAAAWSMFIAGAVTGATLATASDELVEEMFSIGHFPSMAGTLKPDGHATRVDGGYRVSGRWGWGSSIRHADFVGALVFCPEDKTVVRCIVPIADVRLHDNWHVLGMRGTGSCDYELDDVFVPDLRAMNLFDSPQRRGGALYRLGVPGFVVNEHAIFAIAVARLALRTAMDFAVGSERGYVQKTSIADRTGFQRCVAEGELRMKACRRQMEDVLDRLFDSAADGPSDVAIQAEARAMAVLCTDDALAVTGDLFRFAGGKAVYLGSVLERCLRDLYTVQSHFVVSDTAYEIYGRLLLGLSDDAPLA